MSAVTWTDEEWDEAEFDNIEWGLCQPSTPTELTAEEAARQKWWGKLTGQERDNIERMWQLNAQRDFAAEDAAYEEYAAELERLNALTYAGLPDAEKAEWDEEVRTEEAKRAAKDAEWNEKFRAAYAARQAEWDRLQVAKAAGRDVEHQEKELLNAPLWRPS